MRGNPPELDFPISIPELVQRSNRVDENVLSRWAFGVGHYLDGGLIVREDDALAGSMWFRVNIEYNLKRELYAS